MSKYLAILIVVSSYLQTQIQPQVPDKFMFRKNVPPILLLGVEEWWFLPFDAKLYKGDWLIEDIPEIPDFNG